MKVSDYIANYIAALGTSHVFGASALGIGAQSNVFTVAGGNAMHLNDSFGHHPDLTAVYMLHESGAAIAAEAYAKASEKPGVCVVTAGPGVTNALTGCAAAWLESTPVIFVSGDAKTADLNRRDEYGLRQAAQQDVKTIEVVKPITKLAIEARSADEIPGCMEELTRAALCGRPGPVWLSVPLDIQAQDVKDAEIALPTIPKPKLSAGDIANVAELLNAAGHPLLLLGGGVNCAHARREALELVDYLGVPVVTTWPGSDLIPFDHPLFVGRVGPVGLRAANKVLQECSLLISIGARLDPVTTAYDVESFGRNAKRIMIDISEDELTKNLDAVGLAIRADAGDFIRAMLAKAPPAYRPEWVKRCQEIKAQYPFEAQGNSPSYALTNILNEITAPEDIFANGVASYACAIFSTGWKQKAGQRLYSTYGLGSMGCDIPNAIGACLGSGGKRTICITGDGSFAQNVQELEVVRRLGLPIVFFVADNGGYGCIERSQERAFNRLSGASERSGLTLPALQGFAEATGISFDKWSSPSDIFSRVMQVRLNYPPCIIKYVARDEPELPHVTTVIGADGIPHSGALDHMWPDIGEPEKYLTMGTSTIWTA